MKPFYAYPITAPSTRICWPTYPDGKLTPLRGSWPTPPMLLSLIRMVHLLFKTQSCLFTSALEQTQHYVLSLPCGVVSLPLCGSSGLEVGGLFSMCFPPSSSLWTPSFRLGAHSGPLWLVRKEGADGQECVVTGSCPDLALLWSFWCWCSQLMCQPPCRW